MARPNAKPVQLPGGAPVTDTPTDEDLTQSLVGGEAGTEADGTAATSPVTEQPQSTEPATAADQETALLQARLARLEAENASLRAKAAASAADQAAPQSHSYADIPASKIDASALSAPVLSRDGWVVPPPKVDNTRR